MKKSLKEVKQILKDVEIPMKNLKYINGEIHIDLRDISLSRIDKVLKKICSK